MDWKKYSYSNNRVSIVALTTEAERINQAQSLKERPEIILQVDFQSPWKGNTPRMLRTIAFNPIFEASVLTVAKRKSDIPIRAEDPTIAYVEVSNPLSHLSQARASRKRKRFAEEALLLYAVQFWREVLATYPLTTNSWDCVHQRT